jgi:O-antigen ligase
MKSFFRFLFFASLLTGVLIRIQILPGITIYPHDVCLVILFFLYLRPGKRWHWSGHALFFPNALFCGIAFISLLTNFSGYPPGEILTGVAYILRFILYAILYILVSESQEKYLWVRDLYRSGVSFAILGFLQYILYPDLRNLEYLGWDPHYFRLFSTLLDPNFMGIILVITFLAGFLLKKKKRNLTVLCISQILLLSALFFTFSRSSILAFAVGVLFFSIIRKKYALIALVIFMLGLFLVIPKPGGISSSVLREDSSIARLGNWKRGMELFLQKPIFGYGFNMLRSISSPGWSEEPDRILSHAGAGLDNSFLFVLATTGILGGAAWAYIWYEAFRQKWFAWKRNASVGHLVVASILLAVIVHSLFNNSMFYPWVMIFLWIVIGATD